MQRSADHRAGKRIAVLNAVLANAGDAAIALGLVHSLRTALGKDVQFTMYDSLPETTAPHYPEFDVHASVYTLAWKAEARGLVAKARRTVRWRIVRRRLLSRAERLGRRGQALGKHDASAGGILGALHASDLVISTGGTYLVEQYWLGPRLFELDLVQRLRRPLVLFTQSLGPFEKPAVRRALHAVFRYALLVLVRDDRSRQHALEVAPTARVEVRADAAFALAEPAVVQAARTRALPTDRPLRIGISVRDWPHFTTMEAATGMGRYREAVAHLVAHLVREYNAEVVFISTCQGLPAYRYDDSRVAAAIVEKLPAEVRGHVTVETDYLRPEAIMKATGGCDLVVATRMHMAILSLCAGTPVLPIAYEFKTREVFGRLGMEDRVQDIETVTGERLADATERLLVDLPTVRAALFARVEAERADAMAAGVRVREVIEANR
ncbi:MAG: hypothetical protein HKN04_01455 [Rhodothermaceae bacterium]|nr:hypothetical protein [Rhodothermaceae bacterium]